MTKILKLLSPYDSEMFIDREDEIDQVVSILRQPQPRIRAIVFDGERGAGKTWLSLHLHRTVFKKEIRGLTSWLFSLWSPGEGYSPWGENQQTNEHFVSENEKLDIDVFLEEIRKGLSIELPPHPALVEKVDAIRRYVQTHGDERFVLILDSAYESDWSLLDQLETQFLGNLLTLDNFFVIVTGRGRPYPWKIPYLIEAVRFGLGRFSVEQVQEQLKRFNLSSILSVQDIYNIGEGWPIFTEALTRAQKRDDALDIAANIMFAVVRQERQQIRRYFEALCPLEGFGESEAALLVSTYDPSSDEKEGRAICRKMNETRLVSWKNGGYVMNQPVKIILQEYLKLKKPDDWIRLNCVSYRRFKSQCDDSSLTRFHPFFETQMKFHAEVLAVSGVKNPDACPG